MAPSARKPARRASTSVLVRSVSARTLLAIVKAMADKAAESHSTASSAVPRSVGFRRLEIIILQRPPVHADRDGQRDWRKPASIRIQGRHFNSNRTGQHWLDPAHDPFE